MESRQAPGPKLYKGDFCFKYAPRHNFDKFRQELEYTEGELIQMMPKNIRHINSNFENTKKYLAVAYWTADILFISFCHKIKFLSRTLSSKWAMFAFKLGSLVGPAYLYLKIEKKAVQEHQAQVYQLIEDDYRSYQNTGDLLQLNKETKIFDIDWPNDKADQVL